MSGKRRPGPRSWLPAEAGTREWQWAIEDYLRSLTDGGPARRHNHAARRSITEHGPLHRMPARGRDRSNVGRLVRPTGMGSRTPSQQPQRGQRILRAWAYKMGRVPEYLGDLLPGVPQPKAAPRPASDEAWETAWAAADARLRLMLRLAAEAGLRRAEVAQVNTRDVFISRGAAQLMVNGKGGKQRIVPISDELAEALRRGCGRPHARDAFARVAFSRWLWWSPQSGVGG